MNRNPLHQTNISRESLALLSPATLTSMITDILASFTADDRGAIEQDVEALFGALAFSVGTLSALSQVAQATHARFTEQEEKVAFRS